MIFFSFFFYQEDSKRAELRENTTTNCDRAPPQAKEDSFACLPWRIIFVMEKNRVQFLVTDGCKHPPASDIFTPSLHCTLHKPVAKRVAIATAVSVYNKITQMKTNSKNVNIKHHRE